MKDYFNDPESACHKKRIPLWLVLLDNLPTLVLIILGALIIFRLSTIGAVGYVIYSLLSIAWFWAKICPFCHHYGTFSCPCGYGIISARLFKKREDKSFRKVFKQNIGVVFPTWFVPFIIAIYLLLTGYTREVLILTITFSLTGFIIIPLISRFVGCKNCDIKEDCPWMKKKTDQLKKGQGIEVPV
ncbi:MAG: hypothetical protein NTU44_03530 [Bacteroidetes bacterium]|nr:hypothetical protein [Bacteroidota bacterium]